MSEKKAKAARKSGLTSPKKSTGPFPKGNFRVGEPKGYIPRPGGFWDAFGFYQPNPTGKVRREPNSKRERWKKAHQVPAGIEQDMPRSFKRRRYC